MYEEKDYLIRLIHEIARMLIKILTGKDIETEKDICLSIENEEKYKKLVYMINSGEINTAENNLLDSLDLMDEQYILLALLFYEYLDSKSDLFLLEHDFSREEVLDGIKNIAYIYGYGTIAEMIMKDVN